MVSRRVCPCLTCTIYMLARNIVASGLAEKCEVALSYAIGKANPVAVDVHSFGTSKLSDVELGEIVQGVFDLRPAAIIEKLKLRNPNFAATATYGHFRSRLFPWEDVLVMSRELETAAREFV